MASIKKIYSFTNKRDIWRLIPSQSGYLIIEERDKESKQVYFSCLKTEDGKILFSELQLDEKYWIGIEAINKNFIYFHKFRKPDMPGHKGVYAFDVKTKKIIWQNDDLIFLLAKDDNLYVYQNNFEGRQYFLLDAFSGKIIDNLGEDFQQVNKLREESMKNDFSNRFLLPLKLNENQVPNDVLTILKQKLDDDAVSDNIQYLNGENLLFYNFNIKTKSGLYNNTLEVVGKKKNRRILKEELDSKSDNPVFESFFILDDLLFTLVQKSKLVVYRIKQ